jgi:hypothetical protein
MIDRNTEELLTLAEAARLRPPGRNGRPQHISTVYRHALKGFRGVRLEVVRLGGSLYTSRQALQRFAERLTAASVHGAPSQQSTTQRRQACEHAAERLDQVGI